jgi:hypothetical protein
MFQYLGCCAVSDVSYIVQEFMAKWGREDGAASDEEASQASGKFPQPYLSQPSTLPELKEREGGAFQESSPPQGYGGETIVIACEYRCA